jgi:hypothetical protein
MIATSPTPTQPISLKQKPPPSLKKKKILIINTPQQNECNTTTTTTVHMTPTPETPNILNTSIIPSTSNASDTHNISPPRMKEKTAGENAYIQSLSKKEYKAYLIAKSHLITSFSLKKSNGYLTYIASLNTPNTTS